jgi:hypothetical protein
MINCKSHSFLLKSTWILFKRVIMKKIIAILLSAVFALSLCSCESIRKQIKEETVEKIVGKIMGEEVDVTIVSPSASPGDAGPTPTGSGILEDIIESGEDIPWPEDIPSNVPQPGLKITNRIKTPNGVILDFGVSEAAPVAEYAGILKDYLYETIREDISDKKFDASYRKDETQVNVYWYKDGSFSLMITWK